jgi:hypothetical protein
VREQIKTSPIVEHNQIARTEAYVDLRVLEPAIDTGGPMGRMVLTVQGMVAEMEAWLHP